MIVGRRGWASWFFLVGLGGRLGGTGLALGGRLGGTGLALGGRLGGIGLALGGAIGRSSPGSIGTGNGLLFPLAGGAPFGGLISPGSIGTGLGLGIGTTGLGLGLGGLISPGSIGTGLGLGFRSCLSLLSTFFSLGSLASAFAIF